MYTLPRWDTNHFGTINGEDLVMFINLLIIIYKKDLSL